MILPSPQIVVHTSGVAPSQAYPLWTPIQLDLHPGKVPASQVSFPTLNPSLHFGMQFVLVVLDPPEQTHLGSLVEQSSMHPITEKGG